MGRQKSCKQSLLRLFPSTPKIALIGPRPAQLTWPTNPGRCHLKGDLAPPAKHR